MSIVRRQGLCPVRAGRHRTWAAVSRGHARTLSNTPFSQNLYKTSFSPLGEDWNATYISRTAIKLSTTRCSGLIVYVRFPSPRVPTSPCVRGCHQRTVWAPGVFAAAGASALVACVCALSEYTAHAYLLLRLCLPIRVYAKPNARSYGCLRPQCSAAWLILGFLLICNLPLQSEKTGCHHLPSVYLPG